MLTFESSYEALTKRVMEYKEDKTKYWDAKVFKKQLTKLILYTEQEGKCCFCKIQMYADAEFETPPKWQIATIEHVICKSMGGGNHISNYKLSCKRCNDSRGITDFRIFEKIINSPDDIQSFNKHKRREIDRVRIIKNEKTREEELKRAEVARLKKERGRQYQAECMARHQKKLEKKIQCSMNSQKSKESNHCLN